MIPVVCAPEPSTFDSLVRQKGRSAIDEMVGRRPRSGQRRRTRRKKIANRESDIPPSEFPPFWRAALDDMLLAYNRRCGFLAMYLEYGTGNPSVDHMLPKSRRWDLVYEWDNYRLCSAGVNAKKKDLTGLVDPFDCKPGWFALELVGFQVTRGPKAPRPRLPAIDATLALLNTPEFCTARAEYVDAFQSKDISLDYLRRRAPFVASELERQGRAA